MRIRVVTALVIVAVSAWVLPAGTTDAQTLPSVTVAATQQGGVSYGCPPGSPPVESPPQFALIRSGDATAGLTVAVAWSGGATTGAVVSPTSVEFAPRVASVTVTPTFVPSSLPIGGISLTVVSGTGYQPGDPAAASTYIVVAEASCPAPPPPPQVVVNPTFTG